ncbi:hypothetical protein ABC974_07030 [Sphingomonas oligophenolica]|uniref:Uncharacterized protein n=1 Tax=Sphingomonas oligophenolica TaxID=301154 RepID=A0ABU9Y0N1_9SPHN
MQLDLEILTGGTRPATYDEVDEAFLHAIRAIAPERLHEFTAVTEPAHRPLQRVDTVPPAASADEDALSNRDRTPQGGGPASAASDPARQPFTRVDFGSPQAAPQFQPAVFNKGGQGDDPGSHGAGGPGRGGPYSSLISQQEGGLSTPFTGMGDAFVRALVERRERLAQELRDMPSDGLNATANLMRGSRARDLTPNEYKMISDAFPGMIDLSDVKIVKGPGLNPTAYAAFKFGGNPAYTEGNTVYINPNATSNGVPYYAPDLSRTPPRY